MVNCVESFHQIQKIHTIVRVASKFSFTTPFAIFCISSLEIASTSANHDSRSIIALVHTPHAFCFILIVDVITKFYSTIERNSTPWKNSHLWDMHNKPAWELDLGETSPQPKGRKGRWSGRTTPPRAKRYRRVIERYFIEYHHHLI